MVVFLIQLQLMMAFTDVIWSLASYQFFVGWFSHTSHNAQRSSSVTIWVVHLELTPIQMLTTSFGKRMAAVLTSPPMLQIFYFQGCFWLCIYNWVPRGRVNSFITSTWSALVIKAILPLILGEGQHWVPTLLEIWPLSCCQEVGRDLQTLTPISWWQW